MNPAWKFRVAAAVVPVCAGVLALLAATAGPGYGGFGPWSAAGAWLSLMVMPGLALYLALERDPSLLEALGYALAGSPAIVALVAVPVTLAGGRPLAAAVPLVVGASLVAAACALGARLPRPHTPGPRVALLLAVIAVIVAITLALPLSDSWWRIRSDAWAHRAWIAEITDFGVPPMDPYFVGFPLQYMWAYHVLIGTVSDAANIDPFWTMALVNGQALAAFMLCTFLFAGALTRSFGRRIASAITATLGLNAAFWVFLPVKLVKAFTGDTHGWAEVVRQYTIRPFDYLHTMQFMQIFHNKEFFLDKFMVATAFGLALCLMAAMWWAATRYLESGRPSALGMAFTGAVGTIAFHTLVATLMLAGAFGALCLLYFRRTDSTPRGRIVKLALSLLAAVVVTSPYLYSIVYAKESVGEGSPWILVKRFVGVSISIAFVVVLAWFQRGFRRDRRDASRFVRYATAIVILGALVIPLPGPNSYDKPPFLIFYPLAVVGAWSLVDLFERRRALAVTIALLALVPGNALALAACFHTPPTWMPSADDRAMGAWIRDNTPRDAVVLDSDTRVPFIVLGPRRHLWGRLGYAHQWGYDRLEMAKRYHTWKTVYSSAPMDSVTLATLGSVHAPLYVIVRADSNDSINARTLPEYFTPVHRDGGITLEKVDTGRCRADAESGRFPAVGERALLDQF